MDFMYPYPYRIQMASAVEQEHQCDLEPGSFRRSRSRVFFESECTSPTSWEFRGLSSPPPVPMRLSLLRVSGTESGSGGSSKGEVRANGSRNSTGSSTGSHRSQDSGFSDSGETHRGVGGVGGHQRSSSSNHSQNLDQHIYSQNHGIVGNVNRSELNQSELVIPPLLADSNSITNSLLHHHHHQQQHCCQQQYYPSPSQKSAMVNGSQGQFRHHHHQKHHHQYSKNGGSFRSPSPGGEPVVGGDCKNCVYQQEVILARSMNGRAVSPLPQDISVDLGAPTCCSTPKLNPHKGSRLSAMQKIDNFESLNKNKLLDSNNNSSCKETNGSPVLIVNEDVLGLEWRKGLSSDGNLHSTTTTYVSNTSVNHRISISPTNKSIQSSKSNSDRVGGRNGVATSLKSANVEPLKEDLLNDSVDKSSFCTSSSFATYASRSVRSSQTNHMNASTKTTSSPGKWQSLPKGFKRVQGENRGEEPIIVRSQAENDAMRLWLHELRHQAEPECLHTLQTKAIVCEASQSMSWPHQTTTTFTNNNTPCSPSSRLNATALAIHSVSAPLLSIRNVEQMACIISGEFSKICKHLEFGFFAQVPALVGSLADQLEEFLKHFHESFGNLQKLENRLATSCYELRAAAQSLHDLLMSSSGIQGPNNSSNNASRIGNLSPTSPCSPSNPNASQNIYAVIGHDHERQFHMVVGEIVEGIVALGNLFGQVVDQRLTRDLSSILDTIENGGLPARVGLKSFVTILNDGGMHICRLASSIRTVRGLLGVLLDAKDDHDKILALRCLATILCVGEAVKDFDKAGGFEIVADILFDPTYTDSIKYEAVSVLTQATDPWIDLETTLANLGMHLEKIIVSLTNLIPQCKRHEECFLLTIAAISNLTFLEVASLEYLRRYRTVSLIINAVKEKPDFSIFILDHVATVLANMAGAERCRKDIVGSGGIVTLLCFLQQRSSPSESAAEIAACERVQQKSTIAISRLCNEDGVAKLIVEMNGMQRMVQLCRQEKERNYSDGVLIACLATLRKLVSFCGDGVVHGLEAEDLIQPRLLDSFLLYSSRQESYV